MLKQLFFLLLLISTLISCTEHNPNTNASGEDELKSLEINRTLKKNEQRFNAIHYVPIYSDIYFDRTNQKFLLSATLSIRNTSFNDTLFVSKIEYYNTGGERLREYIEKTIAIAPMATVNYVIEKEDESGGHGANFIVELNSNNANIKPIIQAIMIGTIGNKAFSFTSESYTIAE